MNAYLLSSSPKLTQKCPEFSKQTDNPLSNFFIVDIDWGPFLRVRCDLRLLTLELLVHYVSNEAPEVQVRHAVPVRNKTIKFFSHIYKTCSRVHVFAGNLLKIVMFV